MTRSVSAPTHKAEAGEDEEWDGGESQQPAPAQRGHHQYGQQHLEHRAQGPEDLPAVEGGAC